MKKSEILIIADYSDSSPVTFEELCENFSVTPDLINEFIEYEIIYPNVDESAHMLFDMLQLRRMQTALRLQRQLEINSAGIAVVLDLLEELETLRSRTELLEKHLYGK